MIIFLLALISFFICAFGQPAWINPLGYLASTCGLSLFWLAIKKSNLSTKKQIFLSSFLFFMCVQAINLSWMTSIKYQTPFILIVYVTIITFIALQFALLTLFIMKNKLTTFNMIVASSLWVIFEWIRLLPLCGFSFNPIGLYLANNHYSMQLASIGGIYLLSFFVIFTNITAYKMFTKIKYVKLPSLALPTCLPFISLAIFPYLFGICHQTIQQYIHEQPKILKTALLQTALYPEEHSFMPQYDEKKFIPPHMQWQKILTLLKNQITNTVDLIVMPESTVPLLYNQEFLPTDYAIFMLQNTFKENAIKYLPTHASSSISNAFFSQFIANYFNADVVIGMDKDNYNAALIFHPQNGPIESYEKRILVPIGEYIPFNWLKNIVKNFGITGSYAHGHANKIFKGKKANFSVSICYEETFGYMIKQNNADLLINISNDAWFPNSHLPQQHFDHGKIRILENGTPLIRACNIGITGGIDAFGKTIKILSKDANKSGLLILDVPLHHYKTLYSFWGDYFIMLFSCSFVLVFYTIKLAQLKKNKNIIPIDTMH